MNVRLSGRAFAVMVANCAEVYKREAFGFLVGRRQHGAIAVSSAVPCQAGVINGFGTVELLEGRLARLEDVLNKTCAPDRVVGDYHSHPSRGKRNFPPEPGGDDCEDMRKTHRPAYVIVSVRDTKRTVPWHHGADGRLAGTVGSYRMDVKTYYVVSDTICTGHITCPSAITRKF